MKLNISVIYGSVRSSRRGINVARFIVNKLKERGHDVTLVDPMEYKLPMIDKMHKEYEKGKAPEDMEKVHKILQEADAYVVVSAEYNHSVPPALKNILDHYQTEYHYKPSGIVTYSKGPFGGVRGVHNLRAIMGELGTISIPIMFPVSNIDKAIDESGKAIDEAYDKRVIGFLDELEWYAEALKEKREKV